MLRTEIATSLLKILCKSFNPVKSYCETNTTIFVLSRWEKYRWGLTSFVPSSSLVFLQVSSFVTKITYLRGNPGLLFRGCLPRSSAAVSVAALLGWVTMNRLDVIPNHRPVLSNIYGICAVIGFFFFFFFLILSLDHFCSCVFSCGQVFSHCRLNNFISFHY